MVSNKEKDGAEGESEVQATGLLSTPLALPMDGKQHQDSDAISEQKTPLQLLDLPVDIIQSIIRVVTHTNDLTALALTHPALHELVIPHIYSRFDIVWPESEAHVETRVGVDALTYGLATLVMAPDVFGESSNHSQYAGGGGAARPLHPFRKIRRGNHFAQYTKKFSLGNGPPEWVQDYLITKEVGKMLGTLVALAVGRMRSLETFIWDMPTGVLRDVWLALASLSNRDDGQECHLEKVWVRWHDNSDRAALPAEHNVPPHAPNIPTIIPASSTQGLFQIPPYPCVEFPTFSVLPPLKSLTVLDIDEISYAEEMSILIERSLPILRDLRVGIGRQAEKYKWTKCPESGTVAPPPTPALNASKVSRPGGLLGIIFGRFCQAQPTKAETTPSTTNVADVALAKMEPEAEVTEVAAGAEAQGQGNADAQDQTTENSDLSQLTRLLSETTLDDGAATSPAPTPIQVAKREHQKQEASSGTPKVSKDKAESKASKSSSRQLQLETLELERIDICIYTIARAIDWTRLRQVTILGCRNHETLWVELRKKFTPTAKLRPPSSASRSFSTSLGGVMSPSRNGTSISRSVPAEDYPLKLYRLHTDCVSPALINFIKDTLAPDTLESLFLQECPSYTSTVSMEVIYKSAIRRHRGSLRKLLIDSEVRKRNSSTAGSWKKWVCNRDLLTAITSGKMQLRELSMSIEYQDWHFFLQRLPSAATLRSLHIAHIIDHVHETVNSREAALQVLDIVTLRPEMELCYIGVQRQCFEVVEYIPGQRASTHTENASIPAGTDTEGSMASDESPDEQGGGDDLDFDIGSDDGGQTEDEETSTSTKTAFRLREILFYDDKVSIFKARHGRL